MLTIYDEDIVDKKKLNILKKRTKKKQILLYDTQRRFEDFVNKLKYRNNGMYDDIPHYIITKNGIIYQIFDTNYSSKTFDNPDIDKKIIKIAIENLGWLNKNTINGVLFNWIGDPYRTEPYSKDWRGHFYWDRYTEEQYESIYTLCKSLVEKHNIKNQFVTSQGYFTNALKFNGVLCKSNYSDIYTDINPSFNFNIFLKNDEKDNNGI